MSPFRVLYFFSDIFYFLIYYIFSYRKKVVLNNLKLTFPEKSEKELIAISKKFYSHFVDVFIEMIKSFTVSKEEVYKRYKYPNIDFFTELYKDGKKCRFSWTPLCKLGMDNEFGLFCRL